ncbi:MAG: formate dehydrogenase subunit gamma [Thiothrix sp.]|nr:formate dehydrogenase subunit gamma [Thiothrix sp.]HPE59085.1 formate dehydrogenase subunit gamma [Thiolinea sp.]
MVQAATHADIVIAQAITDHAHQPGALLPLLHAIQGELGYIPESAIPQIARALHQSSAEVHGVISFYHQFHTHPPARHRLQICRAEACQARGSRALEQHARQCLGIDFHEKTVDGAIQLDAVYCLGNCATGPNVRVDDQLKGRMDNARFDALLAQLREEESV